MLLLYVELNHVHPIELITYHKTLMPLSRIFFVIVQFNMNKDIFFQKPSVIDNFQNCLTRDSEHV